MFLKKQKQTKVAKKKKLSIKILLQIFPVFLKLSSILTTFPEVKVCLCLSVRPLCR